MKYWVEAKSRHSGKSTDAGSISARLLIASDGCFEKLVLAVEFEAA